MSADTNQTWWTRDRQALVGILLVLCAPFASALISVGALSIGTASSVVFWLAIIAFALVGNLLVWRSIWLFIPGVLVSVAVTGFVGIFVALVFSCGYSSLYCP